MKKLIKSRRGVAIELAIGVMFTMIAFTIMLLSTAGLQTSHRDADYKDFTEKIEINNVGEYVVAHYKENPSNYPSGSRVNIVINGEDTGYYALNYALNDPTVESGNVNLLIYEDGETDFVLSIWLDATGKITSWK